MTALLLSLALAQFATDVYENPAAFEELESKDGVTVSRRAVTHNAYFEYRVTYDAASPVEELCNGVFEWGTRGGDGSGVIAHKVLVEGDDVRVVYDQISQPLVANRDYALTVKRERLEGGACRIRFRITNELAPPKPDGFVRMEKLWGEWHFTPLPKGGARLTYTMFSDPAGSVPPFLVHGTARKVTRESALSAPAKAKQWGEVRK